MGSITLNILINVLTNSILSIEIHKFWSILLKNNLLSLNPSIGHILKMSGDIHEIPIIAITCDLDLFLEYCILVTDRYRSMAINIRCRYDVVVKQMEINVLMSHITDPIVHSSIQICVKFIVKISKLKLLYILLKHCHYKTILYIWNIYYKYNSFTK
jgi:hypothetical protein